MKILLIPDEKSDVDIELAVDLKKVIDEKVKKYGLSYYKGETGDSCEWNYYQAAVFLGDPV